MGPKHLVGDGCRHLQLGLGPTPPWHEEWPQATTIDQGGLAEASPHPQDYGELGYLEVYADLREVFSKQECDALPPHQPANCRIEILPGATLPKPKMYLMTPAELKEMRTFIEKNLKWGFIQPARSQVAAPILFKEKKDGGLHMCVDFRGINAVCIKHLYPLPLMKDMLARLAEGRMFSRLDLWEAYCRVWIRAGDEWKTAFNCPLESCQFRVMPFGLQGAPAVFMQLINEVVHEHLYDGVLVYR